MFPIPLIMYRPAVGGPTRFGLYSVRFAFANALRRRRFMLDIREPGLVVADSHHQRTMPFRRVEKPIRLPGGNFSPRFQIAVVIPTACWIVVTQRSKQAVNYTTLAYSLDGRLAYNCPTENGL